MNANPVYVYVRPYFELVRICGNTIIFISQNLFSMNCEKIIVQSLVEFIMTKNRFDLWFINQNYCLRQVPNYGDDNMK